MRYRITEIRRERGLTPGELAEKARISTPLLLALEAGKLKLVTPQTLLNVAKALETSVDDLFCL